jgi:hypothetical protein
MTSKGVWFRWFAFGAGVFVVANIPPLVRDIAGLVSYRRIFSDATMSAPRGDDLIAARMLVSEQLLRMMTDLMIYQAVVLTVLFFVLLVWLALKV